METQPRGQLSTLVDINYALTTSGKLRMGLARVLEMLERLEEVTRAAVIVIDPMSGQLRTEASVGATGAPGTMTLVQRVVDSGRPMVVPHTAREPLLTRSTRGGVNRSFFCVPIYLNRKSVGALEIETSFRKERDYEAT